MRPEIREYKVYTVHVRAEGEGRLWVNKEGIRYEDRRRR